MMNQELCDIQKYENKLYINQSYKLIALQLYIMKQIQIIEILDSQEEDAKELQSEIAKKIKQFNQTSAELGNNWDKVRYRALTQIDAQNKEQKQTTLKQNIFNYFFLNYKINLKQNFNQRCQLKQMIDQQPNFSDKSIVLFGIDYMSMPRILKYFSYFNPKQIKFIDNSNCLIEFEDAQITEKAIIQNSCIDLQENLDNQMIETFSLDKKKWYQLRSYYQLEFQRKLFCRYAVVEEMDPENQNFTLFYMYQKAKCLFLEKYPPQPSVYRPRRNNNINKDWKRHNRNNQQNNNYNFRNNRNNERNYRNRGHNQSQRYENNRNNTSFRKNNRNSSRVEEEEPELNLSFKKRLRDESVEIDSRMNYSFHKNPDLQERINNKQDEQRYDNLQLSFTKKFMNLNLSIDQNQQDINNTSFNKKNINDESIMEENNMSFKKKNNNDDSIYQDLGFNKKNNIDESRTDFKRKNNGDDSINHDKSFNKKNNKDDSRYEDMSFNKKKNDDSEEMNLSFNKKKHYDY